MNNDYELVFILLDQLEQPQNFKVLFGKKDTSEVVNSRVCPLLLFIDCMSEQNTSGTSKVSIFKLIAQALFPEEFKTLPNQLVSQIKSCVQMYVPS